MIKRQAKWQVRSYRLCLLGCALALFVLLQRTWVTTIGAPNTSSEGRRRLSDSLEDEVRRWPKDVFTDEALFAGAHIFHFFGMLYTFFGIAIVCDEFFVPALEVIVERLDLAHDVAGATFMAAGGSAPELFTSLIGTFISRSQVGFGTIVGSAVFNVLFVIGMCAIFSTGELKLTWWPFARDVIYYGFALFMLTMFFGVNSPNEIEMYEALILLMLYGTYVLLMYYNESLHLWFLSRLGKGKSQDADHHIATPVPGFRVGLLKLLSSLDEEVSFVDLVGAYMVEKIAGNVEKTFKKIDVDGSGSLDADELRVALMKLGVSKDKVDADVKNLILSADTDGDGEVDLDEFKEWYITQKSHTINRVDRLFERYDLNRNGFIDKKEFRAMLTAVNGTTPSKEFYKRAYSEMGAGSKEGVSSKEFTEWYKKTLFKTYRQPEQFRHNPNLIVDPSGNKLEVVDIMKNGVDTMKNGVEADMAAETSTKEEEKEDEPLDISYPKSKGWKSKLQWALTIPIVLPLWLTLFDVRNEKYTKYFYATFLGSIIWLALFSVGMVWWATIVGWCWGIPSTVMGITFIAAGTSVPDLLTSVIVARQGYADMAVSSSIGSNIFDILIGLPLPWLCWCFTHGSVEVGEGDTSLTQSILVLFGMLAAVFITVLLNKWVMTKTLGYTMFVLYVVFLIQYLLTVYDIWT